MSTRRPIHDTQPNQKMFDSSSLRSNSISKLVPPRLQQKCDKPMIRDVVKPNSRRPTWFPRHLHTGPDGYRRQVAVRDGLINGSYIEVSPSSEHELIPLRPCPGETAIGNPAILVRDARKRRPAMRWRWSFAPSKFREPGRR